MRPKAEYLTGLVHTLFEKLNVFKNVTKTTITNVIFTLFHLMKVHNRVDINGCTVSKNSKV